MPRKNYITIKANDKEKSLWKELAYLEGKTLSDYIRERLPVNPEEALEQHNKILEQIREKMNA